MITKRRVLWNKIFHRRRLRRPNSLDLIWTTSLANSKSKILLDVGYYVFSCFVLLTFLRSILNIMVIVGDETVSMVSDTWSTDVLASDSENIDHNHSANSANISSVLSSSGALAMFQNANFPQVCCLSKSSDDCYLLNFIILSSQLIDVSETTSEGWSTDVVVSDSDRVTEVDTDDTASVARYWI